MNRTNKTGQYGRESAISDYDNLIFLSERKRWEAICDLEEIGITFQDLNPGTEIKSGKINLTN